MRKFVIVVYLILLLLAQVSCDRQSTETTRTDKAGSPESPATSDSSRTSADFSHIDEILQKAAPQLGGGVAVILIKADRVVYRKAFGNYKIEQVIPIASSSKWLAGAVLMTMVDDGTLSLDDRVSKYLPHFSEEKAEIILRQLFAHTSGLPAETSCRNNRKTTLEACSGQIARLKLNAQPGTQFFYGGVSMQVGGRVLEVAGGKSWNDLFVEKIATPLGMSKTDFFAYGETGNPRPAGDARSSLDDYGKFLRMILNGGELDGRRILSQTAIEEMHGDQTQGSSIRYTIFGNKGHLDPDLPKATYGVGMWREKVEPQRGKIVIVSSPGALGCYPWIDFEKKVAGAIFTRSTFSESLPVYLRLREAVSQMADQL